MELASLLLYAGLRVTPEKASATAEIVLAAEPVSRRGARAAVGDEDPKAPGLIASYARANAAGDERVHYNLACFASRLSEQVEGDGAEALREMALGHLDRARHHPALRAWAQDDPSLTPMHGVHEFWELTQPAATPAVPSARNAPLHTSPSVEGASSEPPAYDRPAAARKPDPDPWRETLRLAGMRFSRTADLVSVKVQAAEEERVAGGALLPPREFARFLDRFETVPDRALELAIPEATMYRTPKGPLLFVHHDSGPELIGSAARLAADDDHVRSFVHFTVGELASAATPPRTLVVVSRRVEAGERVLGRIEPAARESVVDSQVKEAVGRLTGRSQVL
jgi:hypothetical protein